jgi:hypothetical protein
VRKIYYLIFGGSLFLLVWWNQPYFGWQFCLTSGLSSQNEFVDEVRLTAIKRLEQRISAYRSLGTSELELVELKDKRISQLNLAFDLVMKCLAERPIKYCRYIGPDEHVGLNWQMATPIPADQAHKYKYIIPESRFEIGMAPYRDKALISVGVSYLPEEMTSSINAEKFMKMRTTSVIIANFETCSFSCLCGGG